MSIPFPSIKPIYSEDFIKSLSSPSERQAAFYGVDERYLRFASPAYTSDIEEQYRIHQYETLIVHNDITQIVISHEEQFKNALAILDSGILWGRPAGVIIINSPAYFFDSPINHPDRGAEAFLSHLICSLAHRICLRKNPKLPMRVGVNFLETMQIDHSKEYSMHQNHLLIWGVLTEHCSAYDLQKTIQFLYSFRNHSRILLTSVKDLGELLGKLHINIEHVSYYFNFDIAKTNKKVVVATPTKEEMQLQIVKKVRKPRAKKPLDSSVG